MKIALMSVAHLHADAYIANLRANPVVEMIGIADDNRQRAEQFAQQHAVHIFSDYHALLAANPDAVLICSENNQHRPLVEMAAQAGVHILCEKPLATTVADARAIVACCQQANVLLMTAFPMRFSAPLQQAKAQLDAGTLGQLYALNTTNQGQMPKRHRAWFVDPTMAGGGALIDHIVHLADVLRWWLGCEVSQLYAQANHILHAGEVSVETGGLVMLTFSDGTFASIDCSWSKPLNYPTWGGLTMELVSANGLTVIDAFNQNLVVHQQQADSYFWQPWGSDANQAMIDEFVAAVAEQRQPLVTGEDGLQAQLLVQAAYISAETNQPINL